MSEKNIKAVNPIQLNILSQHTDSRLFTLKEVCEILNISTATGKNWLKLNKLTATRFINNIPYFSESYTYALQKEIQSGKKQALKSRKNKTYISGNGIYKAYLNPASPNKQSVQNVLHFLAENEITLAQNSINYIIAECAIQLLCQALLHKTASKEESCLQAYLQNTLSLTPYATLIDDLIDSKETALQFIELHEGLFAINFIYIDKEDLLGLLYISLKNIGLRKAAGAYYTPTEIVKKLIQKLQESDHSFENKTILDPSCGTGNFLLQLPDDLAIEQLYGNDIDENSVKITHINVALRYKVTDIQLLYDHFTVSNYLITPPKQSFDFIIGNPPWGCSFSKEEKNALRKQFDCAIGKSIESYDLFTEQALRQLTPQGTLSFVLPEAILNVKSHKRIREIIMKKASIPAIEYLGEAFEQVQCPSILLQLKLTTQPFTTIGIKVTTPKDSFTIHTNRRITADCFNFATTDEEYRIIEKILTNKNITTLYNQADFALGIVTGDNKTYISNRKTATNERILKGSDIRKYSINESEHYIVFEPDTFQQSAPAEYYRAPEKLLYRFIGGQLVFAYDDNQTLTLNSCNIVIPHIPGLHMKYILAILNSRVAQFMFTKQFNSIKILRSHIEQIPIPVIAEEEQEPIIELVNLIEASSDEKASDRLYLQLELFIAKLYGLSDEEYKIIQSFSQP